MNADLQATANLQQDVDALIAEGAGRRWHIVQVAPVDVLVSVQSNVDHEWYLLKFVCHGYPEEPFSVRPVDPFEGRSDVRPAWPDCDGFRPDNNDLCLPVCREGFVTHPEWQNDPKWRWDSRGNPLSRVLEELQALLDTPGRYRGRHR